MPVRVSFIRVTHFGLCCGQGTVTFVCQMIEHLSIGEIEGGGAVSENLQTLKYHTPYMSYFHYIYYLL